MYAATHQHSFTLHFDPIFSMSVERLRQLGFDHAKQIVLAIFELATISAKKEEESTTSTQMQREITVFQKEMTQNPAFSH